MKKHTIVKLIKINKKLTDERIAKRNIIKQELEKTKLDIMLLNDEFLKQTTFENSIIQQGGVMLYTGDYKTLIISKLESMHNQESIQLKNLELMNKEVEALYKQSKQYDKIAKQIQKNEAACSLQKERKQLDEFAIKTHSDILYS